MIENIQKHFKDGIVIERSGLTENEFNEWVEGWTTHLTIKGLIRPLTGDKRLSADKETFFGTHKLYCFPADIKKTDRVVFEGRTYNIKFIADLMNFGRLMQIDLEEVE